ncbi:hypothetical protein [Halalkalibacter akibai]|uniref:Uncharacterized protein n=1 Tax=Halalkalibacter akibai (strain ATCC 43226 / DSM 21942 / CIP 109018 / JCM 9157 / 1139) TaxID=1236973 RepID=W4QPD6_HALA3|nr:hypothetical protein [Halalkalibacter akibai]GAE33523.1 hypothetical protein JCM9157_527 [Halalkalibacter akibai JCM 9157]
MEKWLIAFVLILLPGCEALTSEAVSETEEIREIPLSENEKLLFSMLADEWFYIDYHNSSETFNLVEVGVEHYHYGRLVESNKMLTKHHQIKEVNDKRFRLLLTMEAEKIMEEESLLLHGGFNVMYESLPKETSNFEFLRSQPKRDVHSSGYLVDEIKGIHSGEKVYVAYISEYGDMETRGNFDQKRAILPNDEYEHVYMYYLIIDKETL